MGFVLSEGLMILLSKLEDCKTNQNGVTMGYNKYDVDLSRNVGFPHLWSVEFGVPMCIVFLGKAKGPQWSHVDPCGASEV